MTNDKDWDWYCILFRKEKKTNSSLYMGEFKLLNLRGEKKNRNGMHMFQYDTRHDW
jgi:hypothetical protein